MIETHELRYRYSGGPELQFQNISIPQGGLILLRGPSGSGKSTWLALAAGLLRPTEGDIMVARQSIGTLSKVASDAWRAKAIGFLPQKLYLSAALTVHDNLAMAQWAAGRAPDEASIVRALTALDVQALAKRKPAQLSGGQAQRVALARAVLLKPQVILADEPTGSLDDEAAMSSLALLRSTAQREGATLVIATHDARVASFFHNDTALQTLTTGPSKL